MSNSKQLTPGTVITGPHGSYTIIRTLGSGGFGVTYLVETTIKVGNISAQVKFALKEHFMSDLCERGSDTRQVTYSEPVAPTVERAKKAFIKEATRLQSLGVDHPNIVHINEVFEANNTAYYVMEYLDGVTLSEYIKRNGPMDARQTLAIMQPVVDAVATLHEQHITHYDIKPANIMLAAGREGKVRPVLIDFGLSKHYDEEGMDTSTNRLPGYTPGYSPIEQYAGLHAFSPQADVYALAATFYTCLTGQKPPVASGTNADTMTAQIANVVSAEIVSAMHSALQFDQNLRTRDAIELYGQLYQGKQSHPPVPPVEENTHIADDGRTVLDPPGDETHRTSSATPIPPVSTPVASFYSEEEEEPRRNGKAWIWIVVLLLLAGAGIGGYYLFKGDKSDLTNENPEAKRENLNLAERYIAAVKEYAKSDDKAKAAEKINDIIRELSSLTNDDIEAFDNALTKAQKEDKEYVEAEDVLYNDFINDKNDLYGIYKKEDTSTNLYGDDPDEEEEEDIEQQELPEDEPEPELKLVPKPDPEPEPRYYDTPRPRPSENSQNYGNVVSTPVVEYEETRVQPEPVPEYKPRVEEIVNMAIVEQKPQFKGGESEMFKWLSANIEYPQQALEKEVSGKVIVSFVVEKDGSITNVKVVRGKDYYLDREAVRVVSAMPKWIPGKNNGAAVRVQYNLPISFNLKQ